MGVAQLRRAVLSETKPRETKPWERPEYGFLDDREFFERAEKEEAEAFKRLIEDIEKKKKGSEKKKIDRKPDGK